MVAKFPVGLQHVGSTIESNGRGASHPHWVCPCTQGDCSCSSGGDRQGIEVCMKTAKKNMEEMLPASGQDGGGSAQHMAVAGGIRQDLGNTLL